MFFLIKYDHSLLVCPTGMSERAETGQNASQFMKYEILIHCGTDRKFKRLRFFVRSSPLGNTSLD